MKLFFGLASLHTSLLITSTIAGSKIIALPLGLSASATVLSYTCTFLIIDTLTEFYGKSAARFVIVCGFLGMAISALYFELAVALPPSPLWNAQREFETVLIGSVNIWLGGWIAYFLSQNIDIFVFKLLRTNSAFKFGTVKSAISSTLFAQLIDTIIFTVIAFHPVDNLYLTIVGQYSVKLIITLLTGPLTALFVGWGRRYIKLDEAAVS